MDERDLWHGVAPSNDSKWAIRAVLCALVPCFGPLLAAAFVVPALKEIKAGRQGKWLVVAALVLVAVQIAAMIGFSVISSRNAVARGQDETVTHGGRMTSIALRVGDCLGDDPVEPNPDGTQLNVFKVVSCDEPHSREVLARPRLADGDFPGDDEAARLAEESCAAELMDRPALAERDDVGLEYYTPTGDWFTTEHDAICVVSFPEQTGVFLR